LFIIILILVVVLISSWTGDSSTEQHSSVKEQSRGVCGYSFRSAFFHSVPLSFPRRASLLQSAYSNVSATFDDPR